MNKNITINDLAAMVQKGFADTASKNDLKSLKIEMNQRFDLVDKRFDKIEKLILADHKKRIERLEFEVKELKELLAFK